MRSDGSDSRTAIIELIDVGVAFPGQAALFKGLNLSLAPGRTVALTGPSGSGKSTLLSVLAGWLEPTYGEIRRWNAEPIVWVFQNPHGVSQRTAVDHVSLPLLAQGYPRSEAEAKALDLMQNLGVEHTANRPFSSLSGGEAQRLLLARALATKAAVILVDEPTAQLDPSSAHSVVSALGALANHGAVVVIATHDPRVAEKCLDHVDLAAVSEVA